MEGPKHARNDLNLYALMNTNTTIRLRLEHGSVVVVVVVFHIYRYIRVSSCVSICIRYITYIKLIPSCWILDTEYLDLLVLVRIKRSRGLFFVVFTTGKGSHSTNKDPLRSSTGHVQRNLRLFVAVASSYLVRESRKSYQCVCLCLIFYMLGELKNLRVWE